MEDYLPGDGYGFGVRPVDGVSPLMGTAGEATWDGITGTGQKLAVVFLTEAPATRAHYRPLLRVMILGAMTR